MNEPFIKFTPIYNWILVASYFEKMKKTKMSQITMLSITFVHCIMRFGI